MKRKPVKRAVLPAQGTAPQWQTTTHEMRADQCVAFLALCGLISDVERERIYGRALRFFRGADAPPKGEL